MIARINMLDGSEIYLRDLLYIEDVGRDIKFTRKSQLIAGDIPISVYLTKVGEVFANGHVINAVESYDIQTNDHWIETDPETYHHEVEYRYYDYIRSKIVYRDRECDL